MLSNKLHVICGEDRSQTSLELVKNYKINNKSTNKKIAVYFHSIEFSLCEKVAKRYLNYNRNEKQVQKDNNTITATKILTNGFKCFTTVEKMYNVHIMDIVTYTIYNRIGAIVKKSNDYDFLFHIRRALTVKRRWPFFVQVLL